MKNIPYITATGSSALNQLYRLLPKWGSIIHSEKNELGFSGHSDSKESCNAGDLGLSPGLIPWVRKIPWRKNWLPTLVFLPGEFHGQRSLVGYSPWGHKEWIAEWLTLSLSLQFIVKYHFPKKQFFKRKHTCIMKTTKIQKPAKYFL